MNNLIYNENDINVLFDEVNDDNILPITGDYRAVEYGSGVFVALGYGQSHTLYSYNGIDWQISTLPLANYTQLTYGNGKFVVSTYSGWLTRYSTDGINWFGTANTPTGLSGNQGNVKYGNGVWMVQDDLGYVVTSTNGINWDATSTYVGASYSFKALSYGLNKFGMGTSYFDGPTNTVTIEPKFTGEINNVRIQKSL